MKSILDIEVSCFENYNTPAKPKAVNLLQWLNSAKYKKQVDDIRSQDDKGKRDELKAKLPCITPSGLFTYRSQNNLVRHSGFIQIDLDPVTKNKKNLEISNWDDLKNELSKLPQIAYLGESVSGKGYWGLIPIPPEPEKHKSYFESLFDIFLSNWGIELDDKPKSIVSLRGYSYDLNGYFNHNAKQFILLKKFVTVAKNIPESNFISNRDGKYEWLENWILSQISQAMPGNRHDARLKYARLAGGLIAGGYLPQSVEESIISNYLAQYGSIDPETAQKKEINAIRDGVKDGLKFPVDPPPTKCLFVPFTEIKDYSKKAFKIWQGDDIFYIPKSTVYDVIKIGFYVSEYFLKSESKPPKYQADAWKEFIHNSDFISQIPKSKLLTNYSYENEEENRRIEAKINSTEYKVRKVIQNIREENKKESSLKDKIRDCEIPSGAILENKELLKRYRAKYGY
ncbi:BT4734/BF3469 family protein [Cyclobacterium sp. 1_MG-2023]|uniref:BT4734/BF3469 family protein n=1 Tax=Cyclobacterium sp. 1_MG-2023 TaxID=3062681 RepID=UPI0026E389DC|nr:BT4734/BF3469 family protein [Cyclobacterium sp. 1_MG-2023]MDO6439754.1 BT4734/BF3469 family protein [Cyclobacterium sp. 1_MG-2023]